MTYFTSGGKPFFFRGGPTGCLLIHGFTGAPGEMRSLGEHLAAQGYTTLGVRLTGHGTTPPDMADATWRHWLGCALDGWEILRGQCERVFVIGLSMGGMTAINLAAQVPVGGLVAMSTPLFLDPDWRFNFLDLFALFQPYQKKPALPPGQQALVAPGHFAYGVWPVKSIKQLTRYLEATREALPHVAAPALLVHSKNDADIKPENLKLIYDRIGSTDKEMLWLEKSGHVVTEGPERQILFDYIGAFIKSHGG